MFANRKIFIFGIYKWKTICYYVFVIENYLLNGGERVKANRQKLELAMARACVNTDDLQRAAEMPRPTVNNVISGKSVRPATLGRIAKALEVDVTEIID